MREKYYFFVKKVRLIKQANRAHSFQVCGYSIHCFGCWFIITHISWHK